MGHAYTKVGFATECRPRHIFPTPELRARHRVSTCLSTTASEEQWKEILERLFSKIFFHYLSVSPKDRRAIICDSANAPSQFRNALVFVLFKRLGVPSASFVADLVLPLYLTGLSSGIVVDCGHEAARVLATFAGVPVLSALTSAPCGGRHARAALRRSLRARLPDVSGASWLAEDATLEDLAVRAGYVTCNLPAGPKGEPGLTLKTDKAMPFEPPGGGAVTVPAECRWEPFEIFFGGSHAEGRDGNSSDVSTEDEGDGTADEHCNCASLPEAFVETLLRCPVDVRGAVVQNIVVCGGGATLRGLLPRLALELRAALQREPKTKVLAERLLFTPLDFSPVCAVWTGGAVFGALEGVSDYTKEDFEGGKPLPDWARDGFI